MTLQADVGLQRASKLYRALFNWRKPRTGLEKLRNLRQSLRLKDDVTCELSERSPPLKHQQRPSRRQTDVHKAFAGGVGLPYIFFFFGPVGAWQLKFRAGATRLNIFAVQNPSPPKAFILQCLAGDSAHEVQVTGLSGNPTFRPAKHKHFWLCQDGPSVAVLPHCSTAKTASTRSTQRCPKVTGTRAGAQLAWAQTQIRNQKIRPY